MKCTKCNGTGAGKVRDLFEDARARILQRQQRERLMEENERLRKLILAWANDINWAVATSGRSDKFAAITESMKEEALK